MEIVIILSLSVTAVFEWMRCVFSFTMKTLSVQYIADVNAHCILQAVCVVSDLVSRGHFDELDGLVTREVCI